MLLTKTEANGMKSKPFKHSFFLETNNISFEYKAVLYVVCCVL